MARRVVAPDGTRWTVRRRWLHAPLRPRWRGPDDGGLGGIDLPDLDVGDSVLGVIAAVLAIVALAALIAFFLLPLAVLFVEVLVFLVLAAAGLLGRVAFRRPWRIEARADGGRTIRREVAGWRDSRDAIEQLASELERGV